MNCKNCRHWFVNPNIVIPGEPTEGKCLVSEIKTQSNQVCNAWELSQIAEWKDDNEKLTARIAELEGERRWIPVGERLPEIEEGDSKEYDVVITYPRESFVIVACWTYNIFDKTHQRRIWTEDQGEFGHEDITKYVTHWRERPQPPEVQE